MGTPKNHKRGMPFNDASYFFYPWNYQISDTEEETKTERFETLSWAEKPHTIDEIGSTFTIQGFDLNYAGVIIGPSVTYNEQTNQLEFDPDASRSRKAKERRGDADVATNQRNIIENLHNELNVLLSRGVHGLYLFAVDPKLQAKLMEMQRAREERISVGAMTN